MKSRLFIGLILSFIAQACFGAPLGTTFTYQGRLNESGAPADGFYDFEFALVGEPTGTTLLLGYVTTNRVPVSNGLFTVRLDYGSGAFDGQGRWLQIGVRSNGLPTFTPVPLRQPITPSPYAFYAVNAGTASGVSPGAIGTASLATGAVTSDRISNGTILRTDLNPEVLNSTFWNLQGNSGTAPGTHFLGTTDNQPLELRIDNFAALRLQPGGGLPNIIAGSPANSVAAGVSAASIGGGFDNGIRPGSSYSTIAGGERNVIETNSLNATIGGGLANRADGFGASVGGGTGNAANSDRATVAGGDGNLADGDVSFIGGGSGNRISNGIGTIAGGSHNTVVGAYAFLGAGYSNSITLTGLGGTLGGGELNSVDGRYGAIVGGQSNIVSETGGFVGGGTMNVASGFEAAILGGERNDASGLSAFIGAGFQNEASGYGSTIAGGYFHRSAGNGSTVGGGYSNQATADGATVPGGGGNRAAGTNSFAAGLRASADHTGTFVWADYTFDDFDSTGTNQFLVRASGGVGIGTNRPNAQLEVAGTARATSLELTTGPIRSIGAGVATSTPVFIHRATAINTVGHITTIDHPHCNGQPNAILIVTQNWNPGGVGGTYNDHSIGVYYNSTRWTIFNQDAAAMPTGAAFNILVVRP